MNNETKNQKAIDILNDWFSNEPTEETPEPIPIHFPERINE